MEKTHLHDWANEIARENNFELGKIIYQGEYYSPDKIRNIIFEGIYQDKPAVLKIYDDPRLTEEGAALAQFNKENKSEILIAPQVYAYKAINPKKGWLIMEKLPADGRFLTQPLEKGKRGDFLELYLEYRKNLSQSPTRPLNLSENLPAHEFHTFRIERWFQLADDKEADMKAKGELSILEPKEFIPRFERGLGLVRNEFRRRKMIWCHGHFKPHEIFEVPDKNVNYLIDFAHSKMYPQGYELGFIIWSDWIVHADWRLDYSIWKQGVNEWMAEFEKISFQLKIDVFSSLIKASLMERVLGTILADVTAAERPREEKEKRISLLYQLLDGLLS